MTVTNKARPAKFDPLVVDGARLMLRSLMDDLGEDPAALRDAIEADLTTHLNAWLSCKDEHVEECAEDAASVWIATGMVAWMQLRSSTREVTLVIGRPFAKRVEKYAAALVDMAVITGDWWWACAELRTYIEKEIAHGTDRL